MISGASVSLSVMSLVSSVLGCRTTVAGCIGIKLSTLTVCQLLSAAHISSVTPSTPVYFENVKGPRAFVTILPTYLCRRSTRLPALKIKRTSYLARSERLRYSCAILRLCVICRWRRAVKNSSQKLIVAPKSSSAVSSNTGSMV